MTPEQQTVPHNITRSPKELVIKSADSGSYVEGDSHVIVDVMDLIN